MMFKCIGQDDLVRRLEGVWGMIPSEKVGRCLRDDTMMFK